MLDPVVKVASDGGLQCAVHAIGDQAVHNAVNVLEKHGKPGQRHRIEHLELTAPGDARRLGELGITASIQPVHADPSILRAWLKLLGLDTQPLHGLAVQDVDVAAAIYQNSAEMTGPPLCCKGCVEHQGI